MNAISEDHARMSKDS